MVDRAAKQEYIENLSAILGKIESHFREASGYGTIDGFQTRFQDTLDPELELEAWSTDRLRYGRTLMSLNDEVPSMASALLIPRDELKCPALAILNTFGDEGVGLVLYDMYPLGDEPSPPAVEKMAAAAKETRSGRIPLQALPPAMRASMGPEVWMWRGGTYGDMMGTVEDLECLVDIWLQALEEADEVGEEVRDRRVEKREQYLAGLRAAEASARGNMGTMLGSEEAVEPFLTEFYFPEL